MTDTSLTNTTIHILSLPQLLTQTLQPTTPILMDDCQLSWLQVKNALPIICQLISYQLLSSNKNTDILEPSQTQLAVILQSPDIKTLNRIDWENGFNFKNLVSLQPIADALTAQLFSDNQQYHQMLGILMVHTQLSAEQLKPLLTWCSLLAIRVLSDPKNTLMHDTMLCQSWLDLQPILIIASKKDELTRVTEFIDTVSDQYRRQQYQQLDNNPTHVQIHMAEKLQQYVATFPLVLSHSPSLSTPSIALTTDFSNTDSPNTDALKTPYHDQRPYATIRHIAPEMDIFTPAIPKKQGWFNPRQKYWIPTVMIVFSTILAGMSIANHLSKADTNQITTSTPSPQAQNQLPQKQRPKYNDIAIIKLTPEPKTDAHPKTTLKTKKSNQDDKKTKTDNPKKPTQPSKTYKEDKHKKAITEKKTTTATKTVEHKKPISKNNQPKN